MRAVSVAGLVVLGGLAAVAVARRRRRRGAIAARTPPAPIVVTPPHAESTPVPARVLVDAAPHRPVVLPVAGSVALAPELELDTEPWPALHLVSDEAVAVEQEVEEPEPDEPDFPDVAPPATVSWETCELRLWRGYVSWQLYAEAPGSTVAVALSPTFRAPRAKGEHQPSENEAARRAVDELHALLEAMGWQRTGDPSSWHEGRYRRPRSEAGDR